MLQHGGKFYPHHQLQRQDDDLGGEGRERRSKEVRERRERKNNKIGTFPFSHACTHTNIPLGIMFSTQSE